MQHFRIETSNNEIEFAIEGKTIFVEGKKFSEANDAWEAARIICKSRKIRHFNRVVHLYDTDDLAFEASRLSAQIHETFSHLALEDKAPVTVETLEWVSDQLETLAESMPELAEADSFYRYAHFIREVWDFLKIQHTYTTPKRYAEAKRLFDLGETTLKGE